MRFHCLAGSCLLTWCSFAASADVVRREDHGRIAPKVFIISFFADEANVWYNKMPSSGLGDLLAVNISSPGLSMIYPHVHCLADLSVCQATTNMGEINAASTMAALTLSPRFDLTRTYFLTAGIAGVNPKRGTTGTVALAKYAVQVALQYELDAREMPDGFTTGYFPFGADSPLGYPATLYGTEVFELNGRLRDAAYGLALRGGALSDRGDVAAYRARYAARGPAFKKAAEPPAVERCDAATSDVYYSGELLSEAFDNTTRIWTNGSGIYCMTAQEDNAVLEVLVRMHIEKLVDFSRVIVMRTGSNFDRPPPGVTPFEHLRVLHQNGFTIAIDNLFQAGIQIVKGILDAWDSTYKEGIKPGHLTRP
ncbi:hypothetical protein RB595_003151 [Gaeumannomyces hyphopodioides]